MNFLIIYYVFENVISKYYDDLSLLFRILLSTKSALGSSQVSSDLHAMSFHQRKRRNKKVEEAK